jgi:GNAT superfamily N-acetyltransferase
MDSMVAIRAIAAADDDDLRAFYAGLSDESRRTRFLGSTNGIGAGQARYFCTPDHAHREGFVALAGATARAPIRLVGHVCVEPDDGDCAEVAIAVADDAQGQGIGRALVEAAVDWARHDGYRALTATMLAINPAIQLLLTGLALPTTSRWVGAGIVEIRIDLWASRPDSGGLTAA